MDPNKEAEAPVPESPAPEPKVEDSSKAPDVSMSMNDAPTDTPPAPAADASAATPDATAPVAANPGHTLGIASLIVSILQFGLIGIILGILGLNKSKKAGQKNGLALAGIILGAINIVVVTIIVIVSVMGISQLASKCAELGTGTHIESGVTYTCS